MSESVAPSKQPLLLTAPKSNDPPLEVQSSVASAEETAGAKPSLLNKIIGASRKIFQKHGLAYNPAASSPGNISPGAGAGVGGDAPPAAIPGAAPGAAPVPAVDRVFAEKCIEGVLKGFISVRDAGVLSLAVKVTHDKMWSNEAVKRVSPSQEEISLFTTNVVTVLIQFGVPLTYLPALSVLTTLIQWEIRYRGLIHELRDILEDRDKAKKSGNATEAKPGGIA